MSPNPDAPVRGREDGLGSIAGQTLFHGHSSYGEFSKPVKSSSGGDPDVAFRGYGQADGFEQLAGPRAFGANGPDERTGFAELLKPVVSGDPDADRVPGGGRSLLAG